MDLVDAGETGHEGAGGCAGEEIDPGMGMGLTKCLDSREGEEDIADGLEADDEDVIQA